MEFSRPFPSPRNLPFPAIETGSLVLKGDSLPSEPPGKLVFCVFGVCLVFFFFAVLDLSYGTQDLQSSLQHVRSLVSA